MVQLSVRLSEGGAAGVARNLANELESHGVESPFAYGYGPHGKDSPLAHRGETVRITSKATAAFNRLSYEYRGKDSSLLSSQANDNLAAEFEAADVIHLHILHSYFIGTETLFDLIKASGKPVVWTLHDQWIMTGRCAQPGTCRRWTTGCQTCPNLAAYPPARVDQAGRRWTERRRLISDLQASVPTAIVACADWLGDEAKLAGIDNVEVIKNSVDREFWDSATHATIAEPHTGPPRNLFICRDLRDANKVDWEFLERVAGNKGQSLTIVGDNAPGKPGNVEIIPSTNDRAELARIFRRHDRLIFTSDVDYYPLTIAEGLAAGIEVFAMDSRAAREFRGNPLLHILPSKESLADVLQLPHSPPDVALLDPARAYFDPARMTEEYLRLYARLVS